MALKGEVLRDTVRHPGTEPDTGRSPAVTSNPVTVLRRERLPDTDPSPARLPDTDPSPARLPDTDPRPPWVPEEVYPHIPEGLWAACR